MLYLIHLVIETESEEDKERWRWEEYKILVLSRCRDGIIIPLNNLSHLKEPINGALWNPINSYVFCFNFYSNGLIKLQSSQKDVKTIELMLF